MWTDSQLIHTVQLALIGIVVIVGLYLLWRSQQRLDQKIAHITEQITALVSQDELKLKNPISSEGLLNEMQQIFGGSCPINSYDECIYDDDEQQEDNTGVRITEYEDIEVTKAPTFQEQVKEPEPEQVEVQEQVKESVQVEEPVKVPESVKVPEQVHILKNVEGEEDSVSVAESVTKRNQSQTKGYHKLNMDQLRELLVNRNLPTDGTKKELIARLE